MGRDDLGRRRLVKISVVGLLYVGKKLIQKCISLTNKQKKKINKKKKKNKINGHVPLSVDKYRSRLLLS